MDNIKNVQLNPPPDSSKEENMANNKDQKDDDKNKQDDETGYKCGECGAIFSKKAKYCPECGTEFES